MTAIASEIQVTINPVTQDVAVNVVEVLETTTINVVQGTGDVVTIDVAELGLRGLQGEQGDSAYQVWLDAGNTGTVTDFIDSLRPFNMTIGPVAPTSPEVNDLWIDTNI